MDETVVFCDLAMQLMNFLKLIWIWDSNNNSNINNKNSNNKYGVF